MIYSQFNAYLFIYSLAFPISSLISLSQICISSQSIFPGFLVSSYFLQSFSFRHALLFQEMGGEYDIPLAANARTVRDFDQALTRG